MSQLWLSRGGAREVTAMTWILGVASLLFASGQAWAAEPGKSCGVRLSVLEAFNLTGDPAYVPPALNSLLVRTLSGESHGEFIEANSGIGIGRVRARKNPIRLADLGEGCSDSISIAVDLEQSYYGVLADPGKAVSGYAALGILGVILGDGATGAALVQLRAIVRFGADSDSVALTSVGLLEVDLEKAPRRFAMRRAMSRALHQLGYRISEAVDRRLKLGLEPRSVSMTPEKYFELLDRDEGLPAK